MRLIVFDCDGTLVDSQKGIMRGIETAWSEFGLEIPKLSSVLQIIGLSLEDAVAVLEPNLDKETQNKLVETYINVFKNSGGVKDEEEILFDDVKETLQTLNTENTVMAVLTGKSRGGLMATYEKQNIGDFFVISKTADCGPGKPNPHTLNEIITETGVDINRVVMIGDTTHDILTAKNGNIKSIGVSFGYHSVDELNSAGADIIVDKFNELPNAIAKLIGE
ncbi:MAG: HAD-IA family hydrolase [Alphaproteobacteria bacterium]